MKTWKIGGYISPDVKKFMSDTKKSDYIMYIFA